MRKLLRNESTGMSLKDRIKFLKFMKMVTSSEANAYTAGGRAARDFLSGTITKPGVEYSAEVLGLISQGYQRLQKRN